MPIAEASTAGAAAGTGAKGRRSVCTGPAAAAGGIVAVKAAS